MQSSGVDAFVQDVCRLGFETKVEDGLVIYTVLAVDGAHAGSPLETGVEIVELQSWPQVPPHWLHFPAGVDFSRTNSTTSPKSGWMKHSRQIAGWGDAPAGVAWASHIRAVLSDAVA